MNLPTTEADVPDVINARSEWGNATTPFDANGVEVPRCKEVHRKAKRALVYVVDTTRPAKPSGRSPLLVENGKLVTQWVSADGWTLRWANGFEVKL